MQGPPAIGHLAGPLFGGIHIGTVRDEHPHDVHSARIKGLMQCHPGFSEHGIQVAAIAFDQQPC